jgi:hypothetical protein
MDSKHAAELIGTAFELAGVAVLVIGSILSLSLPISSIAWLSVLPSLALAYLD